MVSRAPAYVLLMEIELIDPSLSLWANANAAAQLATMVTARLVCRVRDTRRSVSP